MNAQLQTMDLRVGGNQVVEVVTSIFHTILFNRSSGKFTYKDDDTYTEGAVGFMDVSCDFIDFTYVACSSKELDRRIREAVVGFSDELRNCEGNQNGQISLQFYQRRKKSIWQLQSECIPWEIWNLDVELIKFNNQFHHEKYGEEISQLLSEKIFLIVEALNSHIYLPETPSRSELDTVFDTSFPDIQPYLFNMVHITPNSGSLLTSTKLQLYKFFNKTGLL